MALAAESNAGTYRLHTPVMTAEVCGLLCENAPRLIVDATLGTGGHAEALLEASDATLLGLDRDPFALAAAAERLERFGSRTVLRQANFSDLGDVLNEAGLGAPDAILADLGMSSFALDDAARGFSFRSDGPLDMRMDPAAPIRAYDLVNEEGEDELVRIIREFGEERAAGTRHRGAIHPATRTFQALRVAVNQETESLAAFLERAPQRLGAGGRIAIIAYHSLEDRPVKQCFRALVHEGGFVALTRKALRPASSESAHNPRARSARLRAIARGPQ